jgi:DNA polymerase V
VLDSDGDVQNAILDNVVKAGRLLRRNRLAAGAMSVYLRYGYRHHGVCGYLTEDAMFDRPILSDIELIAAARRLLGKIRKPGYRYTQGGVILCRLSDARYRQRELFGDFENRSKLERFSAAVDAINEYYGERVVYPASLAVKDKKWRPRRMFLSEKLGGFQPAAAN